MKLMDKDRLNLIQTFSRTEFWEMLPIQLNEDEVGLDRQRWEDILQRLIDNERTKDK
jgi:hypothetical protein